MNIRTVCSAISCVVALAVALPSNAGTTPADVRGASSNAIASLEHSVDRSERAPQNFEAEKLYSFVNTAPLMHIEELAAARISVTEAELGYHTKFIADFQQALTAKLSAELDRKIEILAW